MSVPSLKEETKSELLAGKYCVMFPANIAHLQIQGNLYGTIWNFLKGKRCQVFSEVKVVLDDENYFVPDLAIVCDKSKIKRNHIAGAPDFVAEILSPSTRKRDIGYKKDLYERYGVKEYWLIDPVSQVIDTYKLRDGKFVIDGSYHDYDPEDWAELSDEEKAEASLPLKISLYDDLVISVAELFADDSGDK